MRYHFPRTLKAAKASERSQWELGDALLKEATDRDTGERGLNAVVKELADNGIEFTSGYLRSLRVAAETFPPDRRHDLPVQVHIEAGNPDMLDVVAKAAKKSGEKVSMRYVRKVVQRIRTDERAERERAKAKAERELQNAEANEERAQKQRRSARDHQEQEQATRSHVAAIERTRAAKEQLKAAKVAPRVTPTSRSAPAEDDVPVMVLITSLMSNASEAERLAALTEKMLGNNEVPQKYIAGLVDAALSAANAWSKVAAVVRNQTTKRGGHLSVVNE